MSLRVCFLVLLSSLSHFVVAQVDSTLTGTCIPGTSETFLDVNQVRAKVLNNGALFWNKGGPSVYEVPAGSGVHAVYSDAFWVGGMVDSELRVAASTYGPWEFWPGPLDDLGKSPADCAPYDRIWTLNRETDLSDFSRGESPTAPELDWPVHLGAPFLNVDADPGYDPLKGDKPYMLGDQMHWWVMNDVGNVHERTDTNPLGIEVRVSAFAFNSTKELGNVTFYRYQIVNRSLKPITELRVGRFADVDLGSGFDDWVGTDTTLSLVYSYNADNLDDNNYGLNPPAVGFTTIEASHSQGGLPSNSESDADFGDFLTHSMFWYGGGTVQGDPGRAQDFIYLMDSRWKNGEPLTLGGNGIASGTAVKYMFSGDPATRSFWTEINADGLGTSISPADRRMVGSFGPFDLGSGDSATFTYAYVWARGENHLDSVSRLRNLTESIHEAKQSLLTPRGASVPTAVEGRPAVQPQTTFRLEPAYPNPALGVTHLSYSLAADGPADIGVYDMLSRRVMILHNGYQKAGPHELVFNTTSLKPGIYLIQLNATQKTTSRLLTVLR